MRPKNWAPLTLCSWACLIQRQCPAPVPFGSCINVPAKPEERREHMWLSVCAAQAISEQRKWAWEREKMRMGQSMRKPESGQSGDVLQPSGWGEVPKREQNYPAGTQWYSTNKHSQSLPIFNFLNQRQYLCICKRNPVYLQKKSSLFRMFSHINCWHRVTRLNNTSWYKIFCLLYWNPDTFTQYPEFLGNETKLLIITLNFGEIHHRIIEC